MQLSVGHYNAAIFGAINAPSLHHFNGCYLSQRLRDVAMIAVLNELSPGETLRYQDVEDPYSLIRKLILVLGAKIEWSYFKRTVGSVVIDFLRH